MSLPDWLHSPHVRTSIDYLSHTGPVYIATPYSAWAERGEAQAAYDAAVSWQAIIARHGYTGVSPIVLGHPMHLPEWSHARWLEWCRPILDSSASVFIPPIEGRWESVGVKWEAERALSQCKPVVVG